MDYGINIAAAADSWKLVKRAEALGFTHAWFLDTQLLNADPFVAMAAAAVNTAKIRLGTAMLIPSNRIAPVAANAFASLNKLAPGRLDFGVATGFTARRTMGAGPMKLADMEDYIRVVTGLLDEETVDFTFEGEDRRIRFLNPDLDLINTRDPVRLHVSAMGPRGRRLTARLGAGWVIPIGSVDRAVAALDDMKAAWAEAGRDAADLYATASVGGCVLDEGEPYDSPRAKAQAGPSAAMFLHDMVEGSGHGSLAAVVPGELVEAFRAVYEAYEPADARYLSLHRGHLMIVRPEEEHLVTADLIRKMTLTGTMSEMRDWIRALEAAGFSQFTAHVRYGQEQMLETWAEVIGGV